VAHQDGSRSIRGLARDVAARIRDWRHGQRVAPKDAASAGDWRGLMRQRLMACAVLFAVWTVGIEARLIYLQVIRHDELSARADKQQLRTVKLSPKRGEIYDRNGRLLAFSVDADTIAADPGDITDPAEVARRVCAALETCDASLRRQMEDRLRVKKQFVFLARQVGPDAARRVAALELPGIFLYKESRRYYPNRELASHVLGYVGLDNVGLGGLEAAYDARVRGREGKILLLADARQKAMAVREERPATAGDALELTIDQYLQHIAERELRAGVLEDRAAGGTAIIMQPQTGEILALANYPTFNPNAFTEAEPVERRNRAVQDLYEPGSTFKVVTASAALEEHVIRPDDPVDCAPGFITFAGRKPIRDVHPYGVLPFTDVIVKSSNVGAIKVGLRLGPERLSRYVSRFGFGQTNAPDFPGENPGIVWSAESLNDSSLASMSMGYQVGVTPLQMASAVSAVANGGTLFEPRVLRAFIRDGHREEIAPRALRQAISPATAATLTAIMEAVVERGTAKTAQIPGYTIAGKTGTASKVVSGGYSRSEYYASFVGFVPSRKPELVIIVVIDSPHARGYYGGVVAAPVFKRIAEAAVRHLGIPPSLNAPPPVLVARHDGAEPVAAPQPVRMEASAIVEATRAGLMPDLRGLSAREVIRTLGGLGITPRIQGDGFVIAQSPEPGTPIGAANACVLTLGRRVPPVRTGSERP
jgi:cell division protein FtsI (penicillin-binding protein 3)